jgi:hypothetical protein
MNISIKMPGKEHDKMRTKINRECTTSSNTGPAAWNLAGYRAKRDHKVESRMSRHCE